MANYYNLDGIKTQLNKILSREKSLLEAWEKVTFPTKKDGTPFKMFSKNINGANLHDNEYGLRKAVEKKLTVTTFDKLNGYVSDSICCYKQLSDATEEQKAKSENHAPHERMLVDLYIYDIEDIKEAVNIRIEQLKKEIENTTKEIENVDKAYNVFLTSYREAIEALKETAGGRTSLFYMVSQTITDRFPYC